MTKFNYLSDICGSDKPFTARIRLIENVDVEKGTIVYYDNNAFAVTPKKGSLDTIAGVCTETYKAAKNDLVPSHGSGEISVIVSKDALYSVSPIIVTNRGTGKDGKLGTDIGASAITESAGLTSSKLVLVHKAEDSENTAALGTEYKITSAEVVDGFVSFKVEGTIIGSKGDRYAFVPCYGFELINRDANGNLVLGFAEKGDFTVMSATEKGYVVKIKNAG